MGAVAIDINSNERKLEVMFPMNTREGVEVFLAHYNQLEQLMYYSGDYDALIMLIDFDKAFYSCNLTVREQVAIQLVFIKDMKRVDVAKKLGVTKQTVQTWLTRGIDKLVNYYSEREQGAA